jgi:hypothetical protein
MFDVVFDVAIEDAWESPWEAKMFRLKVVALLAIPVVLTTALWAVAVPMAGAMDDDVARLVGFLLLGIALLSAILVARSAVAAPGAKPSSRVHPSVHAGNEFRRGFVSAKAPPRKQRAPQPSEVIALRRRRIEPRIVPSRPVAVPLPTAETIETLKRRLHDRAEKLWNRQAG